MKTSTDTQPSTATVIIGLTILLLMHLCLSADAQTTLMSEDFENGSVSWQFITTSGNGQNYWEVSGGACSNGTDKLMVRRDNSACTYRNNRAHNIMAHRQIDATGYENLTLAFDWVCNGQAGQDYGSVYYSLNGTTWTQITSGGNNGQYQGTTVWGSQTAYSLPSVLDDVVFYIGFNWVNNNSQGSYPAFGVDNVVVQGTVKPAAPPQAPTSGIFSEDFSDGGLPTGWSNTDATANNAGTWSFNNPGSRTINTTTAANGFAIFDSDIIGQDNKAEIGELVTPAFDCSDYAIVSLQLEHYFYFYANSSYDISISGDNGSSYTSLASGATTTTNAETLHFDISSYAAGQSQVRLKFTYTGNYSWYWAIDDILVEGIEADSTTWTGAVSTAWSTAGNWSTGVLPTTATSILVPANAVRMPTVGANTGAGAFNLTIENGATLTVATDSTQGGNLTIMGDLYCNGTIVHSGSALVRLSGAGRVISGDYTIGAADVNWQLESGAGYTLNGDFTTHGIRINSGATLNLAGHTLSAYDFKQYGTLALGNGTLEIAGNTTVLTALGFDGGTGLVHFNSGGVNWNHKPTVSQTVPSVSYYDLQLNPRNGHTITLGSGADVSVVNDLSISNPNAAGGQVTTASTIFVGGDLLLGDTYNNGFTLTVGHRIIGGGVTSGLIFAGNTANNQINITYTNATLASISNFDASSLTLDYPVSYTGLGTQMVVPASYGNLAVGGTGTKALGADITVNGNLTLGSGTLTTAVSMVIEKVSASSPAAVNYLNGGVAANNTVPTLASLISNASSMSIVIPTAYANYSLSGLRVTIPHTYNSDIDVYLASPSGTVYVLSTDNGGNGTGYLNAAFNDAGDANFPNNTILSGTYQPEGFAFADIAGPIDGTWTLYVIDDANQDDGTLTDFVLQLRFSPTHADIALKGNWLNSNGTFTPGTGLVTLNGATQQNVTANSQQFYQLTVNNGAGILLNDDVTVTNTLTLNSGIITTGANRLILTNTASASLAAYGPTAFVNGNLRRYVGYNTQTYALPVGNGTNSTNYRLAELGNNLLQGVSYLDVNFGSLSNHDNADLNVSENGLDIIELHPTGVWVIEPNAQPVSGSYNVKLHLEGFTNLADNEFVVLKRPVGSASGADWTNGNGVLNQENGLGRLLAHGFAMRHGLTSFSEFGIGSGSTGGNPLPIELLEFNAKATEEATVQLDWATAMEIENDFFTIERSADGKEFEAIETIAGAGNSSQMHTYQTFDREPLDGLLYYRLKQTDFDGTYTYSPMRTVLFAKTQEPVSLTVYPNPSNGLFNINIRGLSGAAKVLVTDMQGRVVYADAVSLDAMDNHLSLDFTGNLQPGFYQLQLQGEGQNAAQKLVVQ